MDGVRLLIVQSRWILVRHEAYVLLLLVVRKHHGHTIPKREVLPSEVKPLAALVGPDRADARPDFLALLVLARGLAVIEDIRWCVCHRIGLNDTAFSVGDWQDVSTRGGDVMQRCQPAKKRKNACGPTRGSISVPPEQARQHPCRQRACVGFSHTLPGAEKRGATIAGSFPGQDAQAIPQTHLESEIGWSAWISWFL